MPRRNATTWRLMLAAVLLPAFGAAETFAVKIGDITHLQGSRINHLEGIGLVIGLKGTGDGGKYAPAMRPLAEYQRRFANPVASMEELKEARNVAIVQVEVILPQDGVREGERVDVIVSSIGPAKSLAGGRLLITPLVGPHPQDARGVMAMASGPLHIEDPTVPTVARISEGATLEQDWVHNYIALGRDLTVYRERSAVRPMDWINPDESYITFVIGKPHAEWSVAYTIAQSINEEMSIPGTTTGDLDAQIALAFDPRTVIVRLPQAERANPAPFLARLETLPLAVLPFTEARVTINRKAGTIVLSADTEIAPAVVTVGSLTITTTVPEPPATEEIPRIEERSFIAIDPRKKETARLSDLMEALNQLRVPIEDRIAILVELEKNGKLQATLRMED